MVSLSQFQRTTVTQQSTTHRGSEAWRSLPDSIKSTRTLPSFEWNMRGL